MDDINNTIHFYQIISTLGQMKIMRSNSIFIGAKKGINLFCWDKYSSKVQGEQNFNAFYHYFLPFDDTKLVFRHYFPTF